MSRQVPVDSASAAVLSNFLDDAVAADIENIN